MKKIILLVATVFILPVCSFATDFTATDRLYGVGAGGGQIDQFYQTWADHLTQLSLTFTEPADIDTLAELNTLITDATLLDDGAIADSTAIGLTTGDLYTNFGVVTDDTINELLAAIDTAIGGLSGGHDAVTLAAGVNALVLTGQEISIDAIVEQLADLTPENSSLLGMDSGGNLQFYMSGEQLPIAIGVDTTNFGLLFSNSSSFDTLQEIVDYLDDTVDTVATASKTAAYTIGTDDPREAYGGVVYVSSAATVTAPAVASGMSFSVITIGAVAVSVDTNASDRMYLDGTALDDGDKATNTSTTGDIITCTYESAAGWYCASGSPDGDHWTDGGP